MNFIEPDPIDISELDRELSKAFTKLVDESEKLFRMSYHNWDNQPDWSTKQVKGSDWEVEYSTEDENYVRVDDGTPAHTIPAKGDGFLMFNYPNTPRTFPGRLHSGTPKRGNEFAKIKSVENPGIDPREFSLIVSEQIDDVIEKEFDTANIKVGTL